MSNSELDRLIKLAGIIKEEPEMFRRKKADAGSKRDDFALDKDAERIIAAMDKDDAFDEFDNQDDYSDLPSFGGGEMYDSVDPEGHDGEFEFDTDADSKRIIDVGDEWDSSEDDEREVMSMLMNSTDEEVKPEVEEGGNFVAPGDKTEYNSELDSLLGPEDEDVPDPFSFNPDYDYMPDDPRGPNPVAADDERIRPEEVADEYDNTHHDPFDDNYEHGHGDEDHGDESFPYPDDDASFFQPEFDESEKVVEYEDDLGDADPDEQYFKDFAKRNKVKGKKVDDLVGDEDDFGDSSFDKTEIPMFDDKPAGQDTAAMAEKIMTLLDDVLNRGNENEQLEVEQLLVTSGVDAQSFEEIPFCLTRLSAEQLQNIYSKLGDKNVEEEDLNNGYNNVKKYDAESHFPDGAGGAASQEAGPTSARNGDNPMSVRMKESIKKELTESYKAYKK